MSYESHRNFVLVNPHGLQCFNTNMKFVKGAKHYMSTYCHRMLQMSLLMGLYKAQETSGNSYIQPLVGRVWKVLEMPREVHTYLHYGGRHERSPRLSKEFQRSLVYSCTQTYTQNCVGCSRIFLICEKPSKVLESSIGAYKQVRASFG